MIILNRMVIGGTTINTLDIIHRLKQDFHIVFVTGSKETDEIEVQFLKEELKGIDMLYIPEIKRNINPWYDVLAYTKIKKAIRKYKPDIVHTIGSKPGVIGRLAAKVLKVPVIIHFYHGHLFHSYFNWFSTSLIIGLERWLAGISSRVVVISRMQ